MLEYNYLHRRGQHQHQLGHYQKVQEYIYQRRKVHRQLMQEHL